MADSDSDDIRGIFELHVFVGPLNPDERSLKQFQEICGAHSLKPLHLTLEYPEGGNVRVMQSSRYVTGDRKHAINEIMKDGWTFTSAGMAVLRHKVEALASAEGVPVSNFEEATFDPDRYFEFHLLVSPDSLRDVGCFDMLHCVARELAEIFERPVPLSYNNLKPSQRFLNARFYGIGRESAFKQAEKIKREAEECGFNVEKIIREYIVFDDNVALDEGWLEPKRA